MSLAFYGMPSLAASVYLGLCLVGWLIFSLAGGQVVVLGVRLCRRWFLVASYGACGGNATIDSSRTKKEPLRSSFLFSFILCTLGRLRSLPL
jgi:hypothetical protein